MFGLILLQAAPARLIRLSGIDIAIIAIYFAAVLAVGFYLKEQAFAFWAQTPSHGLGC